MSMNFPQFTNPYMVLVDDDKDDLELVKDIFQELDLIHKIKMLNSGDELLEFMLSLKDKLSFPALIVLDYNMPRLNGLELLIILKSKLNFQDIPIVFYSTTLTIQIEKELLEAGAAYCHQKPTNVQGMKDLMIEFWSIADSFHQRNLLNTSK